MKISESDKNTFLTGVGLYNNKTTMSPSPIVQGLNES
jgi:hypothetical protein